MDICRVQAVNTAIVIGASSGIAKAIVTELADNAEIEQIITISQKELVFNVSNNIHHHISCDYTMNGSGNSASNDANENIARVCLVLSSIKGHITKVFICNGRLHSLNNQMSVHTHNPQASKSPENQQIEPSTVLSPEKRLEDITPASMLSVFQSNTLVPMMWLQHLVKLVNGKQACIISVLSARVGSISENQLGGWYSYRASKAALNMLIKTSAIEYARRAKNTKLIAFHPGTTDTELSKPFQANVPEGKLFTADFVAQQLLTIHQGIEFNNQAEFLDWQGQTVQW
ncbi:SDR family NAD(P)-dependent oxidoreductase [Shewanella sp. WPAGA9]|uniref:SDR family NAD(P)-dependent oxidoreductase n=1 Tax=Shewanella sp. ENK2 TaxID=2775245 RepID=UPI0017817C67|nr:SDR family NAD(P)-dependent oxidoreductase [Shewanella sp. WPAGA9]